jgi:hypothetical protein
MDMERSELLTTAALTNDHSKKHYYKHIHPIDKLISGLEPIAAFFLFEAKETLLNGNSAFVYRATRWQQQLV